MSGGVTDLRFKSSETQEAELVFVSPNCPSYFPAFFHSRLESVSYLKERRR